MNADRPARRTGHRPTVIRTRLVEALGAKMAADERPPTAARSAPAPAPAGEEAPEPKAGTSGPVRSTSTDCGEAGFRASPCHAAPCSTGSGAARSGDTGCREAEARSGAVTRKHGNAEHVQDTGHPLEGSGIRPIPRGASWQGLEDEREDEGEGEKGKPSTAALPMGSGSWTGGPTAALPLKPVGSPSRGAGCGKAARPGPGGGRCGIRIGTPAPPSCPPSAPSHRPVRSRFP